MYVEIKLCLVFRIQRRLKKEMKDLTHIARNELEAMSADFVLSQFMKRCVRLSMALCCFGRKAGR